MTKRYRFIVFCLNKIAEQISNWLRNLYKQLKTLFQNEIQLQFFFKCNLT